MSTQRSLAGITFSYPARTVFRDLDFSVRPGERLGIIGEDGAGKTTLLRLLAGELRPESGALIRQTAGGFGYLRQQPYFEQHWSVADFSAQALSGVLELESAIAARAKDLARASEGQLLSMGLFRPAELLQRLGEMFLGQRRRLDVARLFARPARLLLLDEPTNHISPALADELEQALMESAATVVLISHGRALRTHFVERRIHLEHGTSVR